MRKKLKYTKDFLNSFDKFEEAKSSLGEAKFRLNAKPNPLISLLLAEAYHRNHDYINWIELFRKIQDRFLKLITVEDFKDYLSKKKIKLELVDGENLIGGQFDLDTGEVIVQFSEDILDSIVIANDEELDKIKENFLVNFTHEDTHLQQQIAAKGYKINKDYVKPVHLNWEEIDSSDIPYFNQHIEADAYGREIGERLEKIYKDWSVSQILLSINTNTLDDTYSKKIINMYKDPRIDRKISNSFFRALSDFLLGNEL